MTRLQHIWKSPSTLENQIPDHSRHWLIKSKKLSPVFKTLCRQLTVHRLPQTWTLCFDDEYASLNIPQSAKTFIREVYLLGDNVAWSFGRVVIPEPTYHHWKVQFDTLGENPIGEHLLYKNKAVTRTDFSFCELTPEHPLYQNANQTYVSNTSSLWARRSVFRIDEHYPLLISDVILPSVPSYPNYD